MQHGEVCRTVGAPGSGKTELAKQRFEELLRSALDTASPGAAATGLPVALWCAHRTTADATRDEMVRRLRKATHNIPAVTPQSFAYAVVTAMHTAAGRKPPRLLSGADHDALLGESLAHTLSMGVAVWPQTLHEALACEGFRDELRTLALTADEHGITPQELAQLGREHERPEWVAAAEVFALVDRAQVWAEPAFNHAALQREAARLLHEAGLPRPWSSLSTIIVDDAQELGPSEVAIVRELVGLGVDIELFGDPDCATGGFRGSAPGLWLQPLTAHDHVTIHVLPTVWRHAGAIRNCAESVAQHIGVQGSVRHRQAGAKPSTQQGSADSVIVTAQLPTPAAELAYVAGQLTAAHSDGVPWSELGVIVRSAARLADIEKALQGHGIATGQPPRRRPLGDESVVKLLRAACLLGLRQEVPAPQVWDLIHSDAVRLDPIFDAEFVSVLSGGVPAREFDLATAVRSCANIELDNASPPVTVAVKRLQVIMEAADRTDQQHDALHALWSVWKACELAETWRATALAGGRAGARADDDLDAAMALFDACERYMDRQPDGTLRAFWREVDSLHMAADTLAAQTRTADAVHLLTPALAAGMTLHTVAIVGLEEGLWPNPTPRDSLLGAFDLAGLVTGEKTSAVDKRRDVMNDELRMVYVAVTRARHKVIATSVNDEAVTGSVFFEMLAEHAVEDDLPAEQFVQRPFGAAYTVAQLRRELCACLVRGDTVLAQPYAAALATLADEDVRGAGPDSWNLPVPVLPWSSLAPGQKPVLSPSAVESTIECPLRWFFDTRGFGGDFGLSAEFGTLVHEIAAQVPGGDVLAMLGELEERWPALGLPATWGMEREKLRVQDMLRKWGPRAAARADQVYAVEHSLTAEFDEAIVKGRADRLEEIAPGKLRIVDIKSGSPITKEQALVQDQLGVYQLLIDAGAAGSEYSSAGAELVYLGGNTKTASTREQPPLETDEGQLPWPRQRVREAASIASGSTFEARPGKHCSYCHFEAACPTQLSRATEAPFEPMPSHATTTQEQ